MARPPKPIARLELEGGYRPDRHGSEPMAKGVLVKPKWLTGEASRLWDQLEEQVTEWGAGEVDAANLAGLCRWWAIWRGIDSRLESNPDRRDIVRASMAWKQFTQCAARFGLSPVDRARMRTEAKGEKADLFQELLRSKN